MKCRQMLLSVGLVLVLAASGWTDVMKFDFGRSDRQAKLMKGFTQVTVKDDYADAKGFGWIGVQGKAEAGWLEERSPLAGCCRRSRGQQSAVDDLACDYVGGGGKFGIKLPDGKYVVWMMVGDWGAYEFYPRGKYTVLAEGKVIGELDHSTYAKFKKDFWRHRDDVYTHGENLFEKYVEPRFRKYRAEVDVTGGRLELQVRKDSGPGSYVGPLNAVVVFPVAEKTQGETALKEIADARRAFFEKKYTIVDMHEYYVGDMSKEAGARGFAVWPVDASDDLSLSSRGGRREEPRPFEAMVSLGEMEPVAMVVRPLKKDLGKITCTVGALKGDKGDVLPADAVKVQVVKPWEMIVRATADMVKKGEKQKLRVREGNRVVAAIPYFLVDRNWLEGQLRVNRHFWLTVRMPKTAVSTTYTGEVTVTGAGAEVVKPLNITVLPFALPRSKFAVSVNYSAPSHPNWFDDSKGSYWDIVERDMRLQYDYGMTTVGVLGSFTLPRNPGDENRWEKFVQLYQKIGFKQVLVQGATMGLYRSGTMKEFGSPWDKAWQDAFVKIFRDYEAIAKRYNQKVIYSIGDETTNDGGEAKIIQVGRVVKQRMPDILTMSDINGYRELTGLAPNLNACGFNNGWGGSYQTNRKEHQLMTRDVIERVQALGAETWFINGGKGRYPYGIWFWKTTKWGHKGKIEWHYDASSADLYNPFDGTSINDFGSLVLPEQVSTIKFEMCREGVDDLRYLERLDALIAQHKHTADPFMKGVLDRAIYVRDFWHDCVADRFSAATNPDGSGDYAGNAWPPSRLNRMRREVGKMICMFEGKVVPGVYGDQVICDGDTGSRPNRQLGGLAKWEENSEHATQGKNCYRLTFKGGKGYADQWGRPPEKDWRGYRTLKLDIVNAETRPVKVNLNLRDQFAANLGNHELTHQTKFTCVPGKNSFVLPLVGIKSSGADRELDLSCLFSYHITVDEKQDTTIYVDNMRLCPR